MAADTQLLSTSEVAEILGRSVPTINRWAKEGRLRVAHQLPGEIGARLYDRADVERLAAELAERRAS